MCIYCVSESVLVESESCRSTNSLKDPLMKEKSRNASPTLSSIFESLVSNDPSVRNARQLGKQVETLNTAQNTSVETPETQKSSKQLMTKMRLLSVATHYWAQMPGVLNILSDIQRIRAYAR